MTEVVITAARRTPVGSFLGAFAATPAHELGRIAITAALADAGVAGEEVSEVILGQVLTAAQGQNPARQASMAAGVPKEVPAWGLNQVCGSGLRAVALAAQAIQTGDAEIVVAGGQESMSLSAHAQSLRAGAKMGGVELVDTMVKDGLTDVFNGYHMGITAENLAEQYQVTRADQDAFAVRSQNLAEAARAAGRFADEIAPVTIKGRKGDTVVDSDEYIRSNATIDSVSGVRPAFKKDGTVTAANASGLNDGAAALVLMSAEEAARRGAPVLARIKSWATAGVDPSVMGIGPVPATRKALEKAGWSVGDLDLIEANEAFAAQALSVGRELGLDPDKVNVNGGAIALGHPIGASGARVLTTLLHEMKRRDAKKGLATLCIGGGMGIAMCVERDWPIGQATPATQALHRLRIAFTLHAYDYNPAADHIGLAAAEALGEPPAHVLKTLMTLVDGRPVVAILRSDATVSMKALAAAAGGRTAAMMPPADAERATGYRVGGISPLGQRRAAPTILDADAAALPYLYVNAGRRGL